MKNPSPYKIWVESYTFMLKTVYLICWKVLDIQNIQLRYEVQIATWSRIFAWNAFSFLVFGFVENLLHLSAYIFNFNLLRTLLVRFFNLKKCSGFSILVVGSAKVIDQILYEFKFDFVWLPSGSWCTVLRPMKSFITSSSAISIFLRIFLHTGNPFGGLK